LITLSLSNKAKLSLSFLAVIISIVTLIYYIQNRPNSYDVYMNGKHLAFVESKEKFYDAEKNTEQELEKRFGKVMLNDNIKFEYVKVSAKDLSSANELRESIIKNSNARVSGVLMKSDGKEVGFLANENEMRKVLDSIKDTYKQKDINADFKLKSYITYVKEDISISQVKTKEEIVQIINNDIKNPLICFVKESEISKLKNLSLSRSSSLSKIMYTPSRGGITSPFGVRWGKMHNGIDIGAAMGDPIYAAMDGKVCCTEWEDGYGNVIKIDHGEGVQTIYAHCSSIGVKLGQYVKKGEKIGQVGSTGKSTGPHVHFEVRIDNIAQDPLKYIN
jgi:murein DD-endopeptidase MepM/ murein hydrolase activator NlpD